MPARGRCGCSASPFTTSARRPVSIGCRSTAGNLSTTEDTEDAEGIRFEERVIAAFPQNAERFDLVFSNAALHWVDDHAAFFHRLESALTADGQIAVQMPAMHDDASHLVAMEIAGIEPFRSAL